MTRSVLRSHCKHLHGKAFILSVNVLGQFSFKSKNETLHFIKVRKDFKGACPNLERNFDPGGRKKPWD